MKSRIVEEIKQKKPFATREAEAVVGLLRTADVVRRRLAILVEPFGITLQQYNVLRILRGAGEAGLPTLEIAARMIEETPGITRLLDRLERKGLVRRERCATDRRQVLCWSTPASLELLARLERAVIGADRECFRAFTKKEVDQFIGMLDKVRGA